ncbi:MAG: phosphotransferase [Caldilineaceae bacterium]|nr:phosphotransferase [Caldilineaceae bacterium]
MRASRIWGGYSPTPSYRLALADGRKAFFKATYQASNEFSTQALYEEERIYQELGELLDHWIPQYYATIAHDDWHGLLLEDLGPKTVPPWTPALTRRITHALAVFHRSTLGAALPEWLARPHQFLAGDTWQRVVDTSEGFRRIATMAGESAPQALSWLQFASPTIHALLQQQTLTLEPHALLHGDLRSDNLRYGKGKLYLFDWPAISVGRPEWDTVAFAQSVAVEGGPSPDQVMAWYAEKFPVDAAVLDYSIAYWLAFFARRAWQPEVHGLPRLRRFQRQQLGTLVQWAARHWSLPEPTWAGELLR